MMLDWVAVVKAIQDIMQDGVVVPHSFGNSWWVDKVTDNITDNIVSTICAIKFVPKNEVAYVFEYRKEKIRELRKLLRRMYTKHINKALGIDKSFLQFQENASYGLNTRVLEEMLQEGRKKLLELVRDRVYHYVGKAFQQGLEDLRSFNRTTSFSQFEFDKKIHKIFIQNIQKCTQEIEDALIKEQENLTRPLRIRMQTADMHCKKLQEEQEELTKELNSTQNRKKIEYLFNANLACGLTQETLWALEDL